MSQDQMVNFFDIFLIYIDKHNHNKHCFNEDVEGIKCYGMFSSWLAHRSTHTLQSMTPQISVELVWMIS